MGERSISRRAALSLLAAGGGAAVAGTAAVSQGIPVQAFGLTGGLLESLTERTGPLGTILVARKEDGLLLTFSFVNLEARPRFLGVGPKLALTDPNVPGYVVVGLREQSLLEAAVYHSSSAGPAPATPVPTLMSGPSRIVLSLAPGSEPVDFKLTTLLDLAAFQLAVSQIAESGSAALPTAEPGPHETAIEAPFRLIISPGAAAAFSAVPKPVTRNGRTELWHARAVLREAGQRPVPVPIRAIWSPDLPGGTPLTEPWALDPARTSLSPPLREDLVRATTVNGGPAQAALLLVSPMGASLDINGDWPQRSGIIAWQHRTYLGRENYVKVETTGFLFPLGFPATLVQITDRIHNAGLAHLRRQDFIKVRVPFIAYGHETQPDKGRHLPFKWARTTTLVSPPLIAPGLREDLGAYKWVQVEGPGGARKDLMYQVTFESHDGHVISSELPMVFIPEKPVPPDTIFEPSGMQPTVDLYRAVDPARRTLRLGGQRVGFVPRVGAEDPALPTHELLLDSQIALANTAAARRLAAYPTMASAKVTVEALDAMSGGTSALTEAGPVPTVIGLAKEYLDHEFEAGKNSGEVWAKVKNQLVAAVSQEVGGGLAAPGYQVQGLSRALGPVADPEKIAEGLFDPQAFFPANVTLLGGIQLRDLIPIDLPKFTDPHGPGGDNVPKVVTKRDAKSVDTTITWKPVLQKAGKDDLFEPATTEPDKRMSLVARFHTDLESGATTSEITGDLRNFTLNFIGKGTLGFIRQPVVRLHFESRNGAKPTVDVQLGLATFQGDLQFLEKLKKHLPALPGGIKVDRTPRGVEAGLTIAIPAVAIGVVLVRNLSIGVSLDLPFNGDQAVLGFSLATRENPFQVTVMGLGGGGFLGIGLGTRGVQMIEGSLEFGAAVAINLGVASGSVSIMAGIYFKFAQKQLGTGDPDGTSGNTMVITGYVRAVGKLTVLGLIHISLEFYLGLTFKKEGGQGRVEGVATLSVRVEVLMFSKSVSVTMRKEFGSGADPSFGQQITSGEWATYCAAFAA